MAKKSVTIIDPSAGWGAFDLAALWTYRELLWVLGERDVRLRYKQTILGSAWAILQPLTTMVIFSVVFGAFAKIPSDNLPYPIFAFAGILSWSLFSNTLTSAANSLVGSAHLISKVYFPRLILPLASAIANVMDYMIASIVLVLLMLYYNVGWTLNLLAAAPIAFALVLSSLSIGIPLAAMTAMYRDFKYMLPFLIQTWMFATPIVYPLSMIPDSWRWVFYLNPITGVIEAMRASLLGQPFNIPLLMSSIVMIFVILVAGIVYFARVERRLADVI